VTTESVIAVTEAADILKIEVVVCGRIGDGGS
jgi:hypothetical protein